MSRRLLSLLLSAVGWAGFNVVMLWTVAFLADVVVPRTVDGPPRTSTGVAVGIDLALLLLFAVQHSVMARRQVKAWLRRRLPSSSSARLRARHRRLLVLLLVLWQPFGGDVWHLGGAAAVVLWVGVRRWLGGWRSRRRSRSTTSSSWGCGRPAGSCRERQRPTALQVGGLYAVVRHPLMTGLLVAFWATPHMGASHLLFALAATGYIAIGVRFEERDLRGRSAPRTTSTPPASRTGPSTSVKPRPALPARRPPHRRRRRAGLRLVDLSRRRAGVTPDELAGRGRR